MSQAQAVATIPQPPRSLVEKFASRYSVDSSKLLNTLKATAFQVKDGVSNEQMMALLVVADQYKLNPFTREIYAFPDKQHGVVPIVGVDGWARIINEHPQFDGMEFRESETLGQMDGSAKPAPEWMECVMYRKDRSHAIVVREYLDEVYRPGFVKNKGQNNEYTISGPWQTHTKRFLRHKTMIQTARLAFGFAGIYDPDEGQRIIEATAVETSGEQPIYETRTDSLKARLGAPAVAPAAADPDAAASGEVVDTDTGEILPPDDAATDDPTEITADSLVDQLRALKPGTDLSVVDEIEDLSRALPAKDRKAVKVVAADVRAALGDVPQ